MRPAGHAAVSAVIGASVWGATGSPLAGGVALSVGVLMDVDHIIDYYQGRVRRQSDKVFILFHGWEYSIVGLVILGLVYYQPILLAATLAHLGHVATDHFRNGLAPLGYFILYRVWVRFDAQKIAPGRDVDQPYPSLHDLFHSRSLWDPWYRRETETWIADAVADEPGEPGTRSKK